MPYPNKILLEENEMPTQWYNITADLPEPMPPALHPGTHQPATAEDFAPLTDHRATAEYCARVAANLCTRLYRDLAGTETELEVVGV